MTDQTHVLGPMAVASNPLRLAVLVPSITGRSWRPMFGVCLTRAMVKTAELLEVQVFVREGDHVSELRHGLIDDASQWGADYVLFLDDDIVFPPDAFLRLVGVGKDCVGAAPVSRDEQVQPTIFVETEQFIGPFFIKPGAIGTMPVRRMPLSCMLISMDVFADVPAPWFQVTPLPPYNVAVQADEVFFCELMKRKGKTVLVDQSLSSELRRLKEYEIGWPQAAKVNQLREAAYQKRKQA